LAEAKARKIAADFPNALIIGSDQAVELKGQIFGKPLNHATAIQQLQMMSGQAVNFITGLCLLNTDTDQAYTIVEPFTVIFRKLSLDTIERYLSSEKPYGCAGSFKSEGLGIALCERFIGRDPTALEGLPLIQLCKLLAQENLAVI
ncbi:MAG: septum formation inhibitor Maf, partial [Gammaproteobacteria bacterium]|nr:septum formation inhibitor Maf [Gammaproteobacteria bacterium]